MSDNHLDFDIGTEESFSPFDVLKAGMFSVIFLEISVQP